MCRSSPSVFEPTSTHCKEVSNLAAYPCQYQREPVDRTYPNVGAKFNMRSIKVGILGAGGFAKEVWWYCQSGRALGSKLRFEPVMFIDREATDTPLKGLPVCALDDVPSDVLLLCGIGGMPEIKERVVKHAQNAGRRFAPALIAEGARIGPGVSLGEGTILCPGVIAAIDISIGAHVAVNYDCTIGHDATIEDFATISPGAHVSGWVHLCRGAFLGTSSTIIEKLTVGNYAVLGAGAVALNDIPDYAVAVGVPATVKKFRSIE